MRMRDGLREGRGHLRWPVLETKDLKLELSHLSSQLGKLSTQGAHREGELSKLLGGRIAGRRGGREHGLGGRGESRYEPTIASAADRADAASRSRRLRSFARRAPLALRGRRGRGDDVDAGGGRGSV